MKTISDFCREMQKDEALRTAFLEAARQDRLEAFLKENGCEATAAQVEALLSELLSGAGKALSDREMENAVGGMSSYRLNIRFSDEDLEIIARAHQKVVLVKPSRLDEGERRRRELGITLWRDEPYDYVGEISEEEYLEKLRTYK